MSKKTIIISVYDSCVNWSIYIDGYIIDRDELDFPHRHFPKPLRQIAKEIRNAYHWDCCDKEYLLRKFSNYDSIIYCENGNIEVLK